MEVGDNDAFVTVVCPTCRARLHPRRELMGKRVRCPDCGVAVRVSEREVQAVHASEPAAHGEYQLSEQVQPRDDRPRVLAVCRTCGAKLYPLANLVGKRVRCPDCFQPVVVPPRQEEHKVKARAPVGEYRMDAEPPPLPLAEMISSAAPDKPLYQEEAIPLPASAPKWWFLTGVFSFPFSPGTIGRFAALTFFFLVANALATALFVSLPTLSGSHDAGSAFMVPAMIAFNCIVWTITLAFVSGCIVAVVRDTASGNDEVTDWSDAEIYEGIFRMPYLLFPAMAAGAVGYGIVFAAGRTFPVEWQPALPWVAFAAVALGYSLYLAMVVSALEHGAWYLIISREGLRLIRGYPSGWVLVNLLIAFITGLWVWLTLMGMSWYPYAAVFLGAAPLAAIVLIDARLLGRFLYRASEVVHDKEARAEAEEAVDDEPDEPADE